MYTIVILDDWRGSGKSCPKQLMKIFGPLRFEHEHKAEEIFVGARESKDSCPKIKIVIYL